MKRSLFFIAAWIALGTGGAFAQTTSTTTGTMSGPPEGMRPDTAPNPGTHTSDNSSGLSGQSSGSSGTGISATGAGTQSGSGVQSGGPGAPSAGSPAMRGGYSLRGGNVTGDIGPGNATTGGLSSGASSGASSNTDSGTGGAPIRSSAARASGRADNREQTRRFTTLEECRAYYRQQSARASQGGASSAATGDPCAALQR